MGGVRVSYADFGALAITKASKNANAAFSVASILASKEGALAFNKYLRLPSARRDLLALKPENAYESVFRDSAIRAKAWLDPDPNESDRIFKNMIESITSGRARTNEAVSRAHRELSDFLAK
jgi:ABC-type glycerol-3-phosphate transport system substrate-binding protein